MIGQVIGPKCNVIILAGGQGSRMGEGAEYIPKALVPLGNRRAIDWIIHRHQIVAEKFIIGTGRHGDLLESYVRANYSGLNIEFSHEDEPQNNAISTLLALDHADSRIPTIITFCDLLILGPQDLKVDISELALASNVVTEGKIGTFRHCQRIGVKDPGIMRTPESGLGNDLAGVLGWFYFTDTKALKYIAYRNGLQTDLTESIVANYLYERGDVRSFIHQKVYEFGTEADLAAVRKLWEEA